MGRKKINTEEFIKRATEIHGDKYNYNIIKLFNGDARKISELENKLKINNKKYLYTPKIKFNGMYECFIELENNEEFFII